MAPTSFGVWLLAGFWLLQWNLFNKDVRWHLIAEHLVKTGSTYLQNSRRIGSKWAKIYQKPLKCLKMLNFGGFSRFWRRKIFFSGKSYSGTCTTDQKTSKKSWLEKLVSQYILAIRGHLFATLFGGSKHPTISQFLRQFCTTITF